MEDRFRHTQNQDHQIKVAGGDPRLRPAVTALIRWALWQCRNEHAELLSDARQRRQREARVVCISTGAWRQAA